MARLITKRSSSLGVIPLSTDLEVGELAVNTADRSLYTKHTDASVVLLASAPSKVQIDITTAKFGHVDFTHSLPGVSESDFFLCQLIPNNEWDADELADLVVTAKSQEDGVVFTLSRTGPIVGQFDIAYIKG